MSSPRTGSLASLKHLCVLLAAVAVLAAAGCGAPRSAPAMPIQASSGAGAVDAPRLLVTGPNYFVVGPPSRVRWIKRVASFTDSSGRTRSVPGFQLLDRLGHVITGAVVPGGDGGETNNCRGPISASGVVTSVITNGDRTNVGFAAPEPWSGDQYSVNFTEYLNRALYAQGSVGPFTFAASGTFFMDNASEVSINIELVGPYGLTATGSARVSPGGTC
jgi:hypothetical protein